MASPHLEAVLSLYEVKAERWKKISGLKTHAEIHLPRYPENLRTGFPTFLLVDTKMIGYEVLHTLAHNILYTFKTFCVFKKNHPITAFSFRLGVVLTLMQLKRQLDGILTCLQNVIFLLLF
jgi:hypothetical protein